MAQRKIASPTFSKRRQPPSAARTPHRVAAPLLKGAADVLVGELLERAVVGAELVVVEEAAQAHGGTVRRSLRSKLPTRRY